MQTEAGLRARYGVCIQQTAADQSAVGSVQSMLVQMSSYAAAAGAVS